MPEVKTIPLSNVKRRSISWLWQSYISAATLKRAKDTLGVRAERVDGHWMSSLDD